MHRHLCGLRKNYGLHRPHPPRQDSQTPEVCLDLPVRWTVVSGPDGARLGAWLVQREERRVRKGSSV
ncbi:hypothetical protein K443DRAFT_684917 [Laccaria amethystina LaAM-08-1]|uniref:Uncharacterized protein n=1 Tax=Laccaria amethystina LaAM-08-1 TaxID=1095629 RepID=A0A0C9X9D0_9AGAR|nr:hypothetical protein K443DRAFT_684917 [Laccaria amethystina LaAM-08-1]